MLKKREALHCGIQYSTHCAVVYICHCHLISIDIDFVYFSVRIKWFFENTVYTTIKNMMYTVWCFDSFCFAGLLWNLSSADNLKQELNETALLPLTESIVVPYTLGSDSSTNKLIDPEVFYNTTGCIRLERCYCRSRSTQNMVLWHTGG